LLFAVLNIEDGLVTLIIYLDVWRSGTFPEKPQVSECTSIVNLNHGTTEKLLYNYTECATPSHIHPIFSGKCWGEKAWVWGVKQFLIVVKSF